MDDGGGVDVAWDKTCWKCPVTVPLVLALGSGIGRAVRAPVGFGILTMASIMPILSVVAYRLLAPHAA